MSVPAKPTCAQTFLSAMACTNPPMREKRGLILVCAIRARLGASWLIRKIQTLFWSLRLATDSVQMNSEAYFVRLMEGRHGPGCFTKMRTPARSNLHLIRITQRPSTPHFGIHDGLRGASMLPSPGLVVACTNRLTAE